MSTNKQEQSKAKFDHNWSCYSTDNTNINDNPNWISVQLPHIISSNNKKNWWYRKYFQWKNQFQNDDQRVHLTFESLKDQNIDENSNNDSSIDRLTVWLNEIQIFSGSFQSPKISIDITDQLISNEDPNSSDRKNTLIVRCKNVSLCLHAYLLLPHDMAHAIEREETDTARDKTSNTLPLRKNRVLDYLVGFNDTDRRFDIGFNSRLKSPTISQIPNSPRIIERKNTDDTSERNYSTSSPATNHIFDYLVVYNHIDPKLKSPTLSEHQNPPEIIVSGDDDQADQNSEEFHVPRLNIVMLVVGTRGDVQPFVA